MVVGQMPEGRDVVVVGAGPGGCDLALRASELGRKVTLVDRRGVAGLGGECLHVGCIPSKALIEHAATGSGDRSLNDFQAGRVAIVDGLRAGLQRQLERAGVEVVAGTGRLMTGNRIVVEPAEGPPLFYEHRDAVVATGSRPVALQALPFDGVRVVDSAGVLAFDEVPGRLVVVGGGVVGVELGTAMAKLGAAVTIVEMADRLLPELDADLSAAIARRLGKLGVEVVLRSTVAAFDGGAVVVGERRIEADRVLVAVGRRPNTDGLGLADAGVELDARGLVVTDERCRATAGVHAIGDVRAGPALAHKATAEGRMVAEILAGVRGHRDVGQVPLVVFGDPEVASVGATMADVSASGGELVAGKVPLGASGRAATMGSPAGFVRIVAERSSGAVLGAQIAAPHASELVGVATMAVELGAVLDDLDGMVFVHPTLSEVVQLAARAAKEACS